MGNPAKSWYRDTSQLLLIKFPIKRREVFRLSSPCIRCVHIKQYLSNTPWSMIPQKWFLCLGDPKLGFIWNQGCEVANRYIQSWLTSDVQALPLLLLKRQKVLLGVAKTSPFPRYVRFRRYVTCLLCATGKVFLGASFLDPVKMFILWDQVCGSCESFCISRSSAEDFISRDQKYFFNQVCICQGWR